MALQVILSLMTLGTEAAICCEIFNRDNEPLVKLIGQGRVTTVVGDNIVGRLMIAFVRQPGLAKVYSELLGFEGDECGNPQSSQTPSFADTELVDPDLPQ